MDKKENSKCILANPNGSKAIFDLLSKDQWGYSIDFSHKNDKVTRYQEKFQIQLIDEGRTNEDVKFDLLKRLHAKCDKVIELISKKKELKPDILAPAFSGFTQYTGTVMRRVYVYHGFPFDVQVLMSEDNNLLYCNLSLRVKFN